MDGDKKEETAATADKKKIIDQMDDIRMMIYRDPQGTGGEKARQLQEKAFAAIRSGWKTKDWQDYMRFFASNPAQLARLSGYDEEFNNTSWGPKALAYIAANSTCGLTTTTGTRNNLNPEMVDALDDGIDPTVSEIKEPIQEDKKPDNQS